MEKYDIRGPAVRGIDGSRISSSEEEGFHSGDGRLGAAGSSAVESSGVIRSTMAVNIYVIQRKDQLKNLNISVGSSNH